LEKKHLPGGNDITQSQKQSSPIDGCERPQKAQRRDDLDGIPFGDSASDHEVKMEAANNPGLSLLWQIKEESQP